MSQAQWFLHTNATKKSIPVRLWLTNAYDISRDDGLQWTEHMRTWHGHISQSDGKNNYVLLIIIMKSRTTQIIFIYVSSQ